MNLKIDLKSAKLELKKLQKLFSAHATFSAVLLVLLIYLIMVWRISSLATAEPSAEAQSEALISSSKIPKIDTKAIEQIQALEKSNSEVQSLFDKARNNPFEE